MGQIPRFCIFSLLLFCLYVIPVHSLNFRWSRNFVTVRASWEAEAELHRRQVGSELTEKSKCPLRCEEKLHEVFRSLGYDEILEDVNAGSTPGTLNISPDPDILGKDPNFWCTDKTYLASLYLCLQQHCTEDVSVNGWEDIGKACGGSISSEAEVKEEMQLEAVIEISSIDASKGREAPWIWTKLWVGLTHNQVCGLLNRC